MLNRWTMGQPGWMLVFILVCGFRAGSCDLSLSMESQVVGIKGRSVLIPCTYTASEGVSVERVFWEFKGQSVIKRIDSEDHIQLVKYRHRAVLSESPGDVSLTLMKLDIDDRGDFKCKITGRDKGGKTIDKEGVTILKVLRKAPVTEQPLIPTTQAKATTTETPVTEQPLIPTTRAKATTRASNDEDDSAIVNTKQPRKSNASAASANPLPADSAHNSPVTDAMKGSGIFFYVLIIGILCVVFILTLTTVLLVRRKRRKSLHYDVSTMNQLAINLEGRPCVGGGCQAASNDYQDTLPASGHVSAPSCSNNYELIFPVSEYASLPTCSNEYEQLILQNPQDHDNHVSSSH